MKALYTLATILLVGCTPEKESNKNDCVIVLVDLTDSLTATSELSTNTISSLLRVTLTDPLYGATVTLVPITNLRFNKSFAVSIPCTDKYTSNEIDRKNDIDSFKKYLGLNIDRIKALPIGRNGSAVFENLALQLNELSKCNTCKTRRLIVISDLKQFSPLFNSYDSVLIDKVRNDSKFFEKFMDSNYDIPKSLKGVEVVFLSQPASVSDDSIYYLFSDALKRYLEGRKARVSIKTSLQ